MVKRKTKAKHTRPKAPKKIAALATTNNKGNKLGVNQYTEPDPRQQTFLAFYLDPTSETYSNFLQSALKAGYSQEYSESISAQMPAWLSENLGKMDMLARAERNISSVLDLPTRVQAMGAFGPLVDKKTKKPIMREEAKLLKIKVDTSQFVVERLNPTKYAKQGNPGGNPPPIVPIQINFGDMRKEFAT